MYAIKNSLNTQMTHVGSKLNLDSYWCGKQHRNVMMWPENLWSVSILRRSLDEDGEL